jgi:hypothetical protein
MSRIPVRPFLVAKDENGAFRITIRSTRFQQYPIVTSTLQEETFKTATAARSYLRLNFSADASQIATK